MTTQTEVLKLALEALEKIRDADTAGATPKQITEARKLYEPTITAIKEALAQPEQEPVAWIHRQGNFIEACMNPLHDDEIARGWTEEPLYTTPPQRTWVGLTDEELKPICDEYRMIFGSWAEDFSRAIEAKLKEKNA